MVTFIIIIINVLFSLVFIVSLFLALRDEYNFVNRLSTTVTLRCKLCWRSNCSRFCPKVYSIIEKYAERHSQHSREVQRHLDQNRNDRHSSFSGFFFDTPSSSAPIAKKKRSHERRKRILANQKLAQNKGLTMMPVAQVHEHAQRMNALKKAIRDAEKMTKRREISQRGLIKSVKKLERESIEDEFISKDVLSSLRRLRASGDNSSFRGYNSELLDTISKTISAKKYGKMWKSNSKSRLHSGNVEMVSMPDSRTLASSVKTEDDIQNGRNPLYMDHESHSSGQQRRESMFVNPLFKGKKSNSDENTEES